MLCFKKLLKIKWLNLTITNKPLELLEIIVVDIVISRNC